MTAILQKKIPFDALADAALPGIHPLDPKDWLIFDEAYDEQMAERERLLSQSKDRVHAIEDAALPAAKELLTLVLSTLQECRAFDVQDEWVRCPDGRVVVLDWAQPLVSVGRLVQEDMCLMEKRADEHALTGAVLCFPASWTLSEKFSKPLLDIHVPVPEYDGNIAKRVQRLFDGVRVGRPLWRKNVHWYHDPALFHPRREKAPRAPVKAGQGEYLRVERQSVLRLPETETVVFSIHTFVVHREDVLSWAKSNGDISTPALMR